MVHLGYHITPTSVDSEECGLKRRHTPYLGELSLAFKASLCSRKSSHWRYVTENRIKLALLKYPWEHRWAGAASTPNS
eukprot:1158780-Pelagomonas_calceolata.AAC.4